MLRAEHPVATTSMYRRYIQPFVAKAAAGTSRLLRHDARKNVVRFYLDDPRQFYIKLRRRPARTRGVPSPVQRRFRHFVLHLLDVRHKIVITVLVVALDAVLYPLYPSAPPVQRRPLNITEPHSVHVRYPVP